MPGYGPSSSRDRTAATAYVCVGCVYFILVAGIPTEKFQPLLCWQAQLCKNVLFLKSLFNSLFPWLFFAFTCLARWFPAAWHLHHRLGVVLKKSWQLQIVEMCVSVWLLYWIIWWIYSHKRWAKCFRSPLMWLSLNNNAIWCTCDLVITSNQQC